jgi:flagellar protein FlaG
MNVLQSDFDLSSTNLTTGYAKKTDPDGQVTLPKNVDNTSQQEVVDKASANQALTPEQLEKVAQQLQDFVGDMNRGLEFSVDKDSGRDVIKVIDKSSGDLVKQYPSEEVLTLVSKLSDMVGGFIDAKV